MFDSKTLLFQAQFGNHGNREPSAAATLADELSMALSGQKIHPHGGNLNSICMSCRLSLRWYVEPGTSKCPGTHKTSSQSGRSQHVRSTNKPWVFHTIDSRFKAISIESYSGERKCSPRYGQGALRASLSVDTWIDAPSDLRVGALISTPDMPENVSTHR